MTSDFSFFEGMKKMSSRRYFVYKKRTIFVTVWQSWQHFFISFSLSLWLMGGSSSMISTVQKNEALTKAFQQADIIRHLPWS